MNRLASVAQSVVHLTRNEKVACSSQVTSSTKSRMLIRSGFSFSKDFEKEMYFVINYAHRGASE